MSTISTSPLAGWIVLGARWTAPTTLSGRSWRRKLAQPRRLIYQRQIVFFPITSSFGLRPITPRFSAPLCSPPRCFVLPRHCCFRSFAISTAAPAQPLHVSMLSRFYGFLVFLASRPHYRSPAPREINAAGHLPIAAYPAVTEGIYAPGVTSRFRPRRDADVDPKQNVREQWVAYPQFHSRPHRPRNPVRRMAPSAAFCARHTRACTRAGSPHPRAMPSPWNPTPLALEERPVPPHFMLRPSAEMAMARPSSPTGPERSPNRATRRSSLIWHCVAPLRLRPSPSPHRRLRFGVRSRPYLYPPGRKQALLVVQKRR